MKQAATKHLADVKRHASEVQIASAEIRSVKIPAMVKGMVGDVQGHLVRAAKMLDKQSALMVQQAELIEQLSNGGEHVTGSL